MNEYKRYTWREYRRNHTDADCGGYSDIAYVYELDESGTTIVIAADESTIYESDEAWGFRIDIPAPEVHGYLEIHGPCYTSPEAANEHADIILAVIAAEGVEALPHYINELEVEYV